MADTPLSRILVTRPEHQLAHFCAACKQLGWQALSLPTVSIEPITNGLAPHAKDKLILDTKQLIHSHAGWIVFTSRNAVDLAHTIEPLPWGNTTNTQTYLAIGPATASALEQAGQSVDSPPVSPYTSEAFCNWVLQQRPLPDHILLIKGWGGRGFIQQRLQANKIKVSMVDVYRRGLPVPTERQRDNAFNPLPNIVTVTSIEGLNNLLTIAGPDIGAQLRGLPLVVNSQRMAEHARHLGFHARIEVANPPGDTGQLNAVKQCLQQIHT